VVSILTSSLLRGKAAAGATGEPGKLVRVDSGSDERGREERADADSEVEGVDPVPVLVLGVGKRAPGLVAEEGWQEGEKRVWRRRST
jgi:hypothetical protein